jgi:hypothetical protein
MCRMCWMRSLSLCLLFSPIGCELTLLNEYSMALSLCSWGWHESLGIMWSVVVVFRYVLHWNWCSFLAIVMSKKSLFSLYFFDGNVRLGTGMSKLLRTQCLTVSSLSYTSMWSYCIISLTQVGYLWLAQNFGYFTPRVKGGTNYTGGRVVSTMDLDVSEKGRDKRDSISSPSIS